MIARRLLGARAAWLAVALMALSPALLSRADEIWDTFWFMLVGAALMATFVLAPPRIPIRIFGAGLACGVGAMINPGFTLCYPVWVLYAWWRRRPPGRQVPDLLRYVGLVLAGFVLAIIPWTVRNYRAFGELFYIRGNLPMEIWVGNAPWSDGYFFAADGRRVHPVFDAAEAERMVRLGEWGYFRACREDVVRWWGEDPGRFVRLGTRRVGWFWFGRHEWGESAPRAAMRAAGTAVPGALALLGAVIVLARRRAATVLVLTAMVFPLTYYATIVMVRYRLPIEPLLLVLSAAAIVEAGRFVGGRLRRKAPAGGPTRGDE